MIVCRKPLMLFDVDLAGVATGLALAGLGVWLVVLPWRAAWSRYQEVAAARSAAQDRLHDDVTRLGLAEDALAPLEKLVTDETEDAPDLDSFSALLQQLTEVALACNIDVLSVAPQPMTPYGAYLMCDVQVTARGESRSFIRFLDRLAQDNPFQMLRTCVVTRIPDNLAPECQLAFTLRFYLIALDKAADAPAGGGV